MANSAELKQELAQARALLESELAEANAKRSPANSERELDENEEEDKEEEGIAEQENPIAGLGVGKGGHDEEVVSPAQGDDGEQTESPTKRMRRA